MIPIITSKFTTSRQITNFCFGTKPQLVWSFYNWTKTEIISHKMNLKLIHSTLDLIVFFLPSKIRLGLFLVMVRLGLLIVEQNLILSLFQLLLIQHRQVMCTDYQRMGIFLCLEQVIF